jgi:hypothetical protein
MKLIRRMPKTWIVLVLVTACKLSAQDFCALTANIVNSSDKPISSTWAQLEDASGNIVLRVQTGSVLRICDFGFGAHTLRVGINECLPVTIQNLRLRMGYPISLKVILNTCPAYPQGGNYCPLMLRVMDRQGAPIGHALVSAPSLRSPLSVDSFGRLEIRIIRGKSYDLAISSDGFNSETLRVGCVDYENIDRAIVLERLP